MAKRLKKAFGRVVSGELFWNREKETELFIEKLREGAHITLVAQRRMGKTSLLAETAKMMDGEFICIFVDLQQAKDGPDAIVEMGKKIHERYPSLWKKAKGVFGNIIAQLEGINVGEFGIKLRAGITKSDWTQRGDQLLSLLKQEKQPVVIMIDELPILINHMLRKDGDGLTPEGRAEAEEFMGWLRKNSIEHQGDIRFVVSGSIGLEPVLHQVGLIATINNFVPFELKPWGISAAKGCLEALANEYNVTYEEGVIERICEKLGSNIPHHVQMFFDRIYDRCKHRGEMNVLIKDIDVIYEQEMLSARSQSDLMHYEERLKSVLGDEVVSLAFEMLTEAAVVGKLDAKSISAFQTFYTFDDRDIKEVQKEILWVLEHDGYLRQKNDYYIFVSSLLCDWWKARYRGFYTPILEREE